MIMSDVFICSSSWIRKYSDLAIKKGITHVVIDSRCLNSEIKDKFDILEIPEISDFMQINN